MSDYFDFREIECPVCESTESTFLGYGVNTRVGTFEETRFPSDGFDAVTLCGKAITKGSYMSVWAQKVGE